MDTALAKTNEMRSGRQAKIEFFCYRAQERELSKQASDCLAKIIYTVSSTWTRIKKKKNTQETKKTYQWQIWCMWSLKWRGTAFVSKCKNWNWIWIGKKPQWKKQIASQQLSYRINIREIIYEYPLINQLKSSLAVQTDLDVRTCCASRFASNGRLDRRAHIVFDSITAWKHHLFSTLQKITFKKHFN